MSVEESLAPENELSLKSKRIYEITYKTFDSWRTAHKLTSVSQSMMIEYFEEISEKYKPSSLWSIYSMLKTIIYLKEDIDIGRYRDLLSLLKKKSEGFKSEKSSILTPQHIDKFLTEAPDDIYLAVKVALIIGISGACRKAELTNMKVQDITSEGNLLVVKLIDFKTKRPKIFTIGTEFSRIVKKYANLRPKNATNDRFFLNYKNGMCTVQVIGINTFAKMPGRIANYLKLENPKSYTCHTFRRSSVNLATNTGNNTVTLNRHIDWKSLALTKSDTQKSVQTKAKIFNVIESDVDSSSTSEENSNDESVSQLIKVRGVEAINVGATTSTVKLNLDGFKFVVVEIDRRIEVVQKGWSPPEGAEYVKPHAIFDSYKNASDFAETVNVKKTQRPVAEVTKANPEVISIDGDNSSKRFTIKVNKNIQGKVVEINKNIPRRIVPGNFKANYQTVASKVIRSQFKLTNSGSGIASGGGSGSSSTSNSRPSSVTALGVNKNPKRIIGTMVNKSTPVISVAGGNKITKTKRFIGTLVNKKVNNNSSVTAPAEVNKNVSQNTNNSVQQNLEKQNLNPGNVIIVVEKVDNSSNLITGDVNPTTAQVETDVKDPTLTSNPPPPSQETSEILEPTIKEDPTIKEEFINEEFIDEDDLMVVDPLEI